MALSSRKSQNRGGQRLIASAAVLLAIVAITIAGGLAYKGIAVSSSTKEQAGMTYAEASAVWTAEEQELDRIEKSLEATVALLRGRAESERKRVAVSIDDVRNGKLSIEDFEKIAAESLQHKKEAENFAEEQQRNFDNLKLRHKEQSARAEKARQRMLDLEPK